MRTRWLFAAAATWLVSLAATAVSPTQAAGTQVAARADTSGYVGAQACVACHGQIHQTWKSGRHSKMLQRATADAVKGDFTRSAVTLLGER